jgi:hypothetical protein
VKRSRRGGRRPQNGPSNHSSGNGGGSSGGGGGYNPNRVFDSSGPEIKIRGTASHVYEKYLQLARDANASGDRIMAENYLQHAEHYFRIMAAAQAQAPQFQPQLQTQPQPDAPPPPRQANGTEEQPYLEQPSAESSAPSFSLVEPAGDDDDDEEEEGEEAEA